MALLGAGEAAPATLAFQAFTTHSAVAGSNTMTFTAAAIGAAAADRYVFATIPYDNGGSVNYSIASVTIGGVLATIHSQPFNTGSIRGGCALVSALVPTGTTADIVVTWASGASYYRAAIAVYRVTGLQSSTPFSIATDTALVNGVNANRNLSLSSAKGSIAIVGGYEYGGVTNSRTLTGVTQNYMDSFANNCVRIGGGMTVAAAGTTTATITYGANTSATQWCTVMGCFR